MSNSQLAQEKTAATPLRRSWHFLRGCYRLAQGTFGVAISFLFKAVVVGYFIFCALILGLRYLVLPNIEGYKPQIEELAGRAVGTPVSIGALHASWSGLRPRLALDTVVIHDDAGQPALTLPRVDATLSWLTLLVGELRLNSLEIDRPELEIRRERDGRIFVAGIPIDPGRKSDDGGADWVLSQHEIHIRNGRLRWDDRMRAAPALVLDQVDLILRNGWRTHRLALQARPPTDVAAPLDVRAVFQHPPFAQKISDPRGWHGELYVDVRDTDLAVWRAYVDYPIELQ
ncbi:MAG TPA: AsmA family protein, partial [Noviherbaspirillum sp.]